MTHDPNAEPAADHDPSAWRGYSPPEGGSTPREVRRGHRRHVAVGAIVLVLVVASALALIAISQSGAGSRTTPCSPAPCADDGGGLQVHIDAMNTLSTQDVTGQASATTEVVQVTVRFTNVSQFPRAVDALDFWLRDDRGTVHAVMQVAGPACGIFEARQLGAGSALGPKAMCFTVPKAAQTGLTLVWSPGSRRIDIGLPPR